MEQSQRTATIPDWFNLEKYVQKDFSLLDWTLNLDCRDQLINRIKLAKNECNWKEDRDELRKQFEIISTHGFLNRGLTSNQFDLIKQDFNLRELKPGHGLVYALPLNRAFEIHENIQADTELRHQLALYYDQYIHRDTRNEAMRNREASLKEWHEHVFNGESYDINHAEYYFFSPHICVDLGAPDITLIEAFKSWLKSQRENADLEGAELPEKVSDKLIAKWEGAAILPYLDLLIYQELECISLSNHVVGDAIFPRTVNFDTTEAVRKTTRPNAEKALRQCYGIMRHALIVETLGTSGK